MQNHRYNEVENAFPIVKVSRLVRVHGRALHGPKFLGQARPFFL